MSSERNQQNSQDNARNKRVLFVVTQSELGGAQQFIVRFLANADRGRFEYEVAAGSDGAHALKKSLPANTAYHTIKHLRRNPKLTDDLRAISELQKMYRRIRPDIVVLTSSKAGFVGSLAAQRVKWALPKMKVIYRIGGWSFNDPWPWYKKKIFTTLERISARWKDYIIVNSALDYRMAYELGIKPKRQLLLIHNGIDPYMELLSRDEARTKLLEKIMHKTAKEVSDSVGLFHADFVIGTIANFYPAKDITTLVRAMNFVPEDIACVIIGDGVLRPEIEKEISENDLKNRVFLTGSMPEAHRYLLALDAFVLPSRKEGFPWAILEAMAAKVPVIATNVGAVPEVLDNGRCGIMVRSRDPYELGEAITRLSIDEAVRKEYAMQGHQNLIRNFNVRKMVNEYERLFDLVLS